MLIWLFTKGIRWKFLENIFSHVFSKFSCQIFDTYWECICTSHVLFILRVSIAFPYRNPIQYDPE